ncbi:hypothetical protein [Croceicoccus gelatinilyticus]|uniref:hypothetical protein n=1 Tax=Croceicoccus gelatinilyticus TaxID=2835536 RepID=UPI001BCEBE42|nr:hypothetical protein [Croceicoccus gelatinilyticus]MBS7669360.1 hypothetical protein [Croceicoccus gelatinilyticus]
MSPLAIALLSFWLGGVFAIMSLSIIAARMDGKRWPELSELVWALAWPLTLFMPNLS